MDNDAFVGMENEELARILRGLADKIEGGSWEGVDNTKLFDVNGNYVGSLVIIEEESDDRE